MVVKTLTLQKKTNIYKSKQLHSLVCVSANKLSTDNIQNIVAIQQIKVHTNKSWYKNKLQFVVSSIFLELYDDVTRTFFSSKNCQTYA